MRAKPAADNARFFDVHALATPNGTPEVWWYYTAPYAICILW